ncbi:P-loop NTPase fold protein [Stenotrophomonas maltophilia]|uniref:P-loop NTPase fold protein n=1 Tax=Stenotrophomonas maltophilia TaxID=40324 RepID=UPI000C14CD30|nr:P-loop NTPase fold protein [Stenotrophomonas maltophilia]
MQQLDNYLRAPQPGYAVLISGDWGVGKSYQWERYALRLSERSPITISAAGLETLEDLERTLLQASITLAVPGVVAEVGSVLGKALLRVAKIEPKDITWRAELTREKTVVCIDDIERFAGSFSIIFGFVVNLIDRSGVHCVLIADEARAGERFDDFGKYKERIVGATIHVDPDLPEFCKLTINGFSDDRSRQVLEGGVEHITSLIESARVTNLRTVRTVIGEMKRLAEALPQDSIDQFFKSSLPSAVFFWTVALARDANGRELVRKVFSTDQVGIMLALHDVMKEKGQATEDETSSLSSTLEQLGLSAAVHSWPASQEFIDHMRGSAAVDYQIIAAQFGLLPEVRPYDPLAIIGDYASATDEEVQAAISRAQAELVTGGKNGQTVKLSRIFSIYRSLYFLSFKGVFVETQEEWTQTVLRQLDFYLSAPDLIDCDGYEVWPADYSAEEREVIARCDEIVEVARQHAKGVASTGALSWILSGKGVAPDTDTTPVFSSAPPPEDFLTELRENGIAAVIRLTKAFRKRLSVINSPDYVGGDRDYAQQLMICIERGVPSKRPMTLLDAELRQAMTYLRSFVQKIDRYKG